MTLSPIPGAVLDHVAHAVNKWQDAWPRYATEFGAVWNSGGENAGFSPAQLRFANGARIELLMPHDTGSNDFLARFIARSGPGPHHLTFKVASLLTALDMVREAGFDPVGINCADPEWKEAFIHPKQASGIVVQLAEATGNWTSPPPDEFPISRRERKNGEGPVPPASLLRITHAVADLRTGLDLFGGLLGGQVEARGTVPGEEWVDLHWDGPLAMRLITPTDNDARPEGLSAWLAGRTGRLHHLTLTGEEPDTLSAAHRATSNFPGLAGFASDSPPWIVEPGDNQGLRLVVARAEPPRSVHLM